MTNRTAESLTDIATTALENGAIYNVDFNDLKSAASRVLETALDQWRRAHVYNADRDSATSEASWALLSASILTTPSKKAAKLAEALEGDAGEALRTELAKFAPLRAALLELKPMIVKGRKPSTGENVTPPRTIENTGTCGCCGRNIKRHKSGGLVGHGYRTVHGQKWTADCIGAGHQPISRPGTG